MEETTVISLPVTTLPNPLQSCDSTWLGPVCSSSEAGRSTSIVKATTSLVVSQRLGTVEQTTVPLTLIQTSPTPTPQPPAPVDRGSGSGMDQGLFPSPTPVSLPSTYILITIHQLALQDYESFRQNITEVLKHVVAGYVPVLTVDEEQSNATRTVLQLYFTTPAGMADENATVQAFHQLRNNQALIMQLRLFLQVLSCMAWLVLLLRGLSALFVFRNLTYNFREKHPPPLPPPPPPLHSHGGTGWSLVFQGPLHSLLASYSTSLWVNKIACVWLTNLLTDWLTDWFIYWLIDWL